LRAAEPLFHLGVDLHVSEERRGDGVAGDVVGSEAEPAGHEQQVGGVGRDAHHVHDHELTSGTAITSRGHTPRVINSSDNQVAFSLRTRPSTISSPMVMIAAV
jgi:hypothetical protein